MRLASYSYRGWTGAGVVVDDHIIDVHKASRHLAPYDARSHLPGSIRELLALGEPGLRATADVVEETESSDALNERARRSIRFRLDEVELLPPVLDPPKIFAIGLNYREHAAEAGRDVPDYPMLFAKYTSTLVGHGGEIRIPRVSTQIDYEGELGVVIGRHAKDVPAEKAYDYVAGYMPMNDVSARDYQRLTSQFNAGKNFDTFGPCGPWLTLTDEVRDPHDLQLETRVNGEVLQSSSTGDMIFDVPTLIEFISGIATLEPGDIIVTGTPSGIGARRDPPRWLTAGDEVEVSISGLGTLSNLVVDRN